MTLAVDLYWMAETPAGHKWRRYLTVEEEEVKEDELTIPHGPTMTLTLDEAQTLMDELWHAGMRPSNIGDPNARIEQYKDEVKWLREMLASWNK